MEIPESIINVLSMITEWIELRTKPNSSRKYSRCPICDQAWWDDKEIHNFGCWIPWLKKANSLIHKDCTEG